MTPAARPAFADRAQAGRALAAGLGDEAGPRTVVVGLARGGVPVAAAVARELGAPLDAVVVRKVGDPAIPELALGAVTADGRLTLPPPSQRSRPPAAAAVEAARVQARFAEERLRAGRPALPLSGAVCILVDDGLATGASMRAAVGWARGRGGAGRRGRPGVLPRGGPCTARRGRRRGVRARERRPLVGRSVV